MGNIGIIGRARVGKDTVGQWLVNNRGYRRIGFADPLKEAALKLDPIIHATAERSSTYGYGGEIVPVWDTETHPLSDIVRRMGWEAAKDEFPEVRRILQELGAAVRAIDEDFWLRAAMRRVQEANEAGVPAVITDVRYPNEAASLRRAGFHLVYIERPDVEQLVHESEGALGPEDAGWMIRNEDDLESFLVDVEGFAYHVERTESRRHYARTH
ncbi:hypothetical protein [Streptomyces sp. NPDC058542]|uniref:deoxynucleotide monophosphate kinase family protein n=1 Tax=Streptomyces sp. NPDC058542 TaxID=3346543 RepID=UPI00365F2E0C